MLPLAGNGDIRSSLHSWNLLLAFSQVLSSVSISVCFYISGSSTFEKWFLLSSLNHILRFSYILPWNFWWLDIGRFSIGCGFRFLYVLIIISYSVLLSFFERNWYESSNIWAGSDLYVRDNTKESLRRFRNCKLVCTWPDHGRFHYGLFRDS